ncbi:MAG: ergothioneine biosynthesis protein EgtB [Arcticibacterium sp.]
MAALPNGLQKYIILLVRAKGVSWHELLKKRPKSLVNRILGNRYGYSYVGHIQDIPIRMNPLLKKYLETRKCSESLCQSLGVEDYIPQSAEFASPPKWHLAHTTWFFEEMILSEFSTDYKVFDESYRFLFNSYYNSIGDRLVRGDRGLITRPSVARVYEFRAFVDNQMTILLDGDTSEALRQLMVLGINHEQQHQELLLTDLKYTFSRNPTYPVYSEKAFVTTKNKEEGWLTISEGVYEIGHKSVGFSFDNELGRHKVYLHSCEISKCLVTNGEYITFIESGAYQKPELWLDEGWAWVKANKTEKPLYWYHVNGEWFHYTLAGLKKIDSTDILAHISYYEATAFAQWKGCRLPTEFEWETASTQFEWGDRWEWTNSAYLPYPNFEIAPGAVGEYNGKFMINQMVLRGGSVATAEGHTRTTYRNFFHPHMAWQFSGIRLAK